MIVKDGGEAPRPTAAGGEVPPEVADLARRIELLAVASALVLIHGRERAWRRGVALGLWADRPEDARPTTPAQAPRGRP